MTEVSFGIMTPPFEAVAPPLAVPSPHPEPAIGSYLAARDLYPSRQARIEAARATFRTKNPAAMLPSLCVSNALPASPGSPVSIEPAVSWSPWPPVHGNGPPASSSIPSTPSSWITVPTSTLAHRSAYPLHRSAPRLAYPTQAATSAFGHIPGSAPLAGAPPGAYFPPRRRLSQRAPLRGVAPRARAIAARPRRALRTAAEWAAVDALLGLSRSVPNSGAEPTVVVGGGSGGAHPRKFGCTRCASAFKRRYDLNQHVSAVHLRQQPFACPRCAKRFSHNGTMRKHVRTVHLKEKPFSCTMPDCAMTFSEKGNLNKHVSRKHGVQSPPPASTSRSR